MRTNANSVAAYYNEVSYGQQQLNITVACATAPVASGCAAHTAAGGLAAGQRRHAGRLRLHHHRQPGRPGGHGGGLQPRQLQEPLLRAARTLLWLGGVGLRRLPLPGMEQRLQRAVGLRPRARAQLHAVACGQPTTAGAQVLGGSCNVAEYGDRFDIMGNNSNANEQMHFNAAQKSLLNWIPASSVKTHTSGTATYTLSPLESGGQTTYAVKIPVAADSNRTYWIEYRQPIGFDSGIAAYPNNGAQIRVASPFDYPCGRCGGDDTELLDMTPGSSGGFYDAALLAGQTYTDSAYGISVTVNSATSSALNLTVSMGGRTATTTTLASSGSPSLVGANVTFTATVNGSAPTGSVVSPPMARR